MNRYVLPSRASAALAWLTIGLLRLMMEKVLENPDLVGWTPDDVVKLGKEWIQTDLFSLKCEHKKVVRLVFL